MSQTHPAHPNSSDALLPLATQRVLNRKPGRWSIIVAEIKHYGQAPATYSGTAQSGFSINYVIQGEGSYEQHNGPAWPLKANSLFLRNPQVPHTTHFYPHTHFQELFIVFDKFTSQLLTETVILGNRPLVANLDSEPWVLPRLANLVHRMNRPDYEAPTLPLMLEILQTVDDAYHAVCSGDSDHWDVIISHAARAIADHPQGRTDLERLAAQHNVSYTAFRRAFKELRGVAPGRFQIQCRIQKACRLLRHHPIAEVAEALAYADQFTFSRQFKKYVGVAPKHFQHKLTHPQPEGSLAR